MDSDQSNPFATLHTRPGALKFRFIEGEDETTIVERLRSQQWWGQIIGPHGSGKSTLLAALVSALEVAGRRVQCHALHEGERRLDVSLDDWQCMTSTTQLVIDGYEQLGRLARWSVLRHCRRLNCGLLVTTHRDLGLPTVCTMNPQLELALDVVRQLMPAGDDTIRACDVEAAWRKCGGNMREMLFDLYDLFERRRRPGG